MSGERHGRGIFDCPMPMCHEAIIGGYSDLLDHLRANHPLSNIVADRGIGTIREQVKVAQKQALRSDIRELMFVSSSAVETEGHSTTNTDN